MKSITDIMNENSSPSLAEECRKLGLNYSAVVMRIHSGWSREDALSKPINTQKKHKLNGKEIKIKHYCEKNDLDYFTVKNRLHQSGMRLEDAINFKKGKFNKRYELNGERVSIREECKRRGLNYITVMGRLQRGKSPKEALVDIPKRNLERSAFNEKCKKLGINPSLVKARLKKGWSKKDAFKPKN